MKRTFQPNNRKKNKTHGFLKRQSSNINKQRRNKGRKKITK